MSKSRRLFYTKKTIAHVRIGRLTWSVAYYQYDNGQINVTAWSVSIEKKVWQVLLCHGSLTSRPNTLFFITIHKAKIEKQDHGKQCIVSYKTNTNQLELSFIQRTGMGATNQQGH